MGERGKTLTLGVLQWEAVCVALRANGEDFLAESIEVVPDGSSAYEPNRLQALEDWKAGATGAATITYPPRVGPHTEEAYCAHKAAYERGSENYRIGADVIAAAVQARCNPVRDTDWEQKEWEAFVSGHHDGKVGGPT